MPNTTLQVIRINESVWVNPHHIVEMELFVDGSERHLTIVLSNEARYTIEGLWVGSVLANLVTAAKVAE